MALKSSTVLYLLIEFSSVLTALQNVNFIFVCKCIDLHKYSHNIVIFISFSKYHNVNFFN